MGNIFGGYDEDVFTLVYDTIGTEKVSDSFNEVMSGMDKIEKKAEGMSKRITASGKKFMQNTSDNSKGFITKMSDTFGDIDDILDNIGEGGMGKKFLNIKDFGSGNFDKLEEGADRAANAVEKVTNLMKEVSEMPETEAYKIPKGFEDVPPELLDIRKETISSRIGRYEDAMEESFIEPNKRMDKSTKMLMEDIYGENGLFGEGGKKKTKWFKMEFLGIMFAGMQIQRSFQGLLRPAMEAEGIFETFSDTLSTAFGPAAEFISGIVDSITDSMDNWGDTTSWVMNVFAVSGLILGTLVFTLGQATMAWYSFLEGWKTLRVWLGVDKIKATLGKAVDYMSNLSIFTTRSAKGMTTLKGGLGGVGLALGGLLATGGIASLFDIDIDEVVENLTGTFDGIVEWVKDPGNWGTIAAALISGIAVIYLGIPALITKLGALLVTVIGTFILTNLGPIWNGLKDVIGGVWDWISNKISGVWNWLKDNIFSPIITWVSGALSTIWDTLKNAVMWAWDGISSGISKVWNWLKDNIFTPIRTFIDDMIINVWKKLKDSVIDVWDGIRNTISGVWGTISGIWDKIKTTIGSVIPNPFELVSKGLDMIATAFGKIYNYLNDASGGTISSIFNWLKNAIGLAEGGLVTRPTLAMVGEAGPEAVIPLNRMGGVGGNTITYAPVYHFGSVRSEADKRNITRTINDENEMFFKQHGLV